PLEQAVAALINLLSAFRTVHECGMLQRDNHPRNTLIRGTDARSIMLIDFSASVFLDQRGEWRSDSTRGGISPYIAPEWHDNAKPLDTRYDQFGAAGIGVFLLTGHDPFLWPPNIPRNE